jgi:hypothetical protein
MTSSAVACGSALRPRASFPVACVTFLILLRSGIPEILAFHGERNGESCGVADIIGHLLTREARNRRRMFGLGIGAPQPLVLQ